MSAPKKPYTRPTVTELDPSDPRALELFASTSGLVRCCDIWWSVSASTDWHVGVTAGAGASFDGLCGKCRKPLVARPA